ncbi:hypothetical protein ACQY0O_003951 [Thecaphora frezii]
MTVHSLPLQRAVIPIWRAELKRSRPSADACIADRETRVSKPSPLEPACHDDGIPPWQRQDLCHDYSPPVPAQLHCSSPSREGALRRNYSQVPIQRGHCPLPRVNPDALALTLATSNKNQQRQAAREFKVMSDPSKTNGNYNSVKGTVVETIGNLTGSTDWQKSGKETHAKGEAEIKAAEAKGYAEGLGDQISGKKDNIIGAITGDKSQQAAGSAREDKGKAQKELNK